MATGITDSANYQAIAEAIRTQNGGTETYAPSEMAAAVLAIKGTSEVEGAQRLTNITFTETGFSITGESGGVAVFTYGFDDAGNIISVSDESGFVTTVSGVSL